MSEQLEFCRLLKFKRVRCSLPLTACTHTRGPAKPYERRKMPPAKRGKLTHNEGAQYHAARLRKDLSVIFELPTVPLDVVPAEQPAAFRGSLYMYQRRSLARMLEIEQGTQFSVQIGMSTQSFSPKGGVVADSALLATTLESAALTRSAQLSASAPRCSASALLMLRPPACAAQRWAWARRPS